MDIKRARRVLERIRVMALNNEFSGEASYRSAIGGKWCGCAVSAVLPPALLSDVTHHGYIAQRIGDVFRKFGRTHGDVESVTGLPLFMLDDLQRCHDAFDLTGEFNGRNPDYRERANTAVLGWTIAQLAELF